MRRRACPGRLPKDGPVKTFMKKLLVLPALFILPILLFSACASGEEPGGEDPRPEEVQSGETQPEGENAELRPEVSRVLPAPVRAKTVYLISDPPSFADKLTLGTLQGIAALKCEDQIMVEIGAFDLFRRALTADFGCKVKINVDGRAVTVASLLEHYLPVLDGYILAAPEQTSPSGSVAVSLAGILNAVAVTPANEKICKDLGMRMLLDAREKDDAWLRGSEYWDKLSRSVAVEQPLSLAPKLIDYAVFRGAYFSFYDGHDREEHAKKYAFLDKGAIVLGFNNTLGEYDTVLSLSRLDLQLIASDHAYNLATLSGFSAPPLKQKRISEPEEEGGNVHTVCFLLSDGDNLQWVLNDFATSERWFASPDRGSFAMGWGLPALTADLASPMAAYLYDRMTKKDEFVLQISGLGYTFPSRWDRESRLEMTDALARVMRSSDLRFAAILDDGGFEESVLSDFTSQSGIDGLFYIDYFDYAGMKGRTLWTNGKPAVSARYRLWAGFEDSSIEYVAEKINAAPKDPRSIDSYSFVTVHAWSGLSGDKLTAWGNPVSAVKKLIGSLDPSVEVVTPSVFMDRIIRNRAE